MKKTATYIYNGRTYILLDDGLWRSTLDDGETPVGLLPSDPSQKKLNKLFEENGSTSAQSNSGLSAAEQQRLSRLAATQRAAGMSADLRGGDGEIELEVKPFVDDNRNPITTTASSSTADENESNDSFIPEPTLIPRPEKLGPEAIKISNEIIAQQDVINKFVKDNGGTADANWSDEVRAEYNNELNKLAELDEKLIQLAKTDASANCLAREFIGKPMSLPGTPDCATIQGTIAYKNARDELQKSLDLPDPCGKSDLSKINTTLLKFFNDLKAIRKFGDTYINSSVNEIYRITNLIRNTASIIGSIMKGLMQNLRNWLIDKIRKGIQLLIDNLFPTLAKQFKNTIIGQIIDNILCKFKDIIDNLRQLVADFLFELVGKVVNAPLCAVQQFTNGLINNVVAMVDEALGPVLDSINDLLGGIGKIAGSIFEAIDFILGFEAYLCQKPNCPEIKSTVLGPWANSPNKPFGDGFDNFINNAEEDFSEEGIQKYVNGLKFLVAVVLVQLERQLLMISDKFMASIWKMEVLDT